MVFFVFSGIKPFSLDSLQCRKNGKSLAKTASFSLT